MSKEKNNQQNHPKKDEVIIHKRYYGDQINESVREKRLDKESGAPKRNTIKYETNKDSNDDFFKKK
ncbi:hypothetical protein ACFFH2_15820 [Enterococcus devriesei]|uniref:Uncharacterized protein n=1 Tax=Enterococcus devriesei TaxID=319970 RepID=A0A1L8SUE1_9ENTE|nr:hypothetical protein [Enterococcus devriesei]OJG35588.1 hypothetical protein RV00_GL002773 [Enterococcus devriesei]